MDSCIELALFTISKLGSLVLIVLDNLTRIYLKIEAFMLVKAFSLHEYIIAFGNHTQQKSIALLKWELLS